MIDIINTNIPNNSNRRIIDALFKIQGWIYAKDSVAPNINKPDTGFLLSTYDFFPGKIYCQNDILNTYAYMILDIVNQNSLIKIKEVKRIQWNWYNPYSQTEFHKDFDEERYYSIIYSIHNSDGGTEFKINDKTTFYKSNESKALLFPSILYHRGKAPKDKPNRFSLNIMGEI